MIRMVVIDDEIWALRGFTGLLDWAELGIEIIGSYQQTEQAMEAIRRDKPEIVVTDVYLQDTTGDKLIRQLKEEHASCETVLISAFKDFETIRKVLSYGTFSYIVKPYVREEVREVFERLCRRIRERDGRERITQEQFLSTSFTGQGREHYLLLPADGTKPASGQTAGRCETIQVEGTGTVMLLTDPPAAWIEELRREAGNLPGLGLSGCHPDFSRLNRMLSEAKWSRQLRFSFSENTLTAAMQFYICEHVSEKISLSDIAERFYMSPVYLSRQFSRYAGMGPVVFINRMKINMALLLMEESGASCREIAEMTGFDNYNYFGRLFKRQTGVSPERYLRTRKRG